MSLELSTPVMTRQEARALTDQIKIGLRAYRARERRTVGIRKNDDRPHSVYVCRDSDGLALYVGISLTAIERLTNHQQRGWWGEVRRIDIHPAPSRRASLELESQLILRLYPQHNISGKGNQ